MELGLSRSTPHLELQEYGPLTGAVKYTRDRWLSKLGQHIGRVRKHFKSHSGEASAILTAVSAVLEKTFKKGDI